MVTASLKREFERQGVTLLPVADGVQSLLQEMTGGVGRPVEVVIGSMLNPVGIETAPPEPRAHLSILFEREIDVNTHPILKSHVIDGKPVVPMALIAEWFGHGALHENPGLLLRGLEDMRILNGIRLAGESKLIRVLAGKARRKAGFYEVDLELRNGVRGQDVLHSGRAIWLRITTRPRSTGCRRPCPATTIRGRRPKFMKRSSSTAAISMACGGLNVARRMEWSQK
jgi:hypothetical protein